jgi:hypothetical protein
MALPLLEAIDPPTGFGHASGCLARFRRLRIGPLKELYNYRPGVLTRAVYLSGRAGAGGAARKEKQQSRAGNEVKEESRQRVVAPATIGYNAIPMTSKS